jgi:hypothetical protein
VPRRRLESRIQRFVERPNDHQDKGEG